MPNFFITTTKAESNHFQQQQDTPISRIWGITYIHDLGIIFVKIFVCKNINPNVDKVKSS